jgi:LysM repeat protein
VLIDYTVVSGDSLWKIAHEHGTTVGKLKKINSLSTDNLSIGQKIKVPQIVSAAPSSSSQNQ